MKPLWYVTVLSIYVLIIMSIKAHGCSIMYGIKVAKLYSKLSQKKWTKVCKCFYQCCSHSVVVKHWTVSLPLVCMYVCNICLMYMYVNGNL